MKTRRTKHNYNDSTYRDWHKLVVAEEGFSMLNIYADHAHGVSIELIRRFADTVNSRNEAGSLHPIAPISAIPRSYFRTIEENQSDDHITGFKRKVCSFLESNRISIKASKILIDLHVSSEPVPEQYLKAIEEVFNDFPDDGIVKDVVIFV